MPPERVGHGVNFLVRLIQFILWLIVATWLGRKLLGWLFDPAASAAANQPGSHRVPRREAKKLFRDPVCGMHVSAEIAQTFEQGGQTQYFCSAKCREQFRIEQRQAARPDKLGASA